MPILAYMKTSNGSLFVICPVKSRRSLFHEALRVIVSNYPLKQLPDGKVDLRPYEAFVLEVK